MIMKSEAAIRANRRLPMGSTARVPFLRGLGLGLLSLLVLLLSSRIATCYVAFVV